MNLCAEHSMPCCRICTRTTKPPFGEGPRKQLKKSGKRRPMNAQQYLSALGKAKANQGGKCVGLIAGIDHECSDPFDACHVIPQQTITKHTEDPKALSDPRNILYACRWIHSRFDAGQIELPDPDGFAGYCAEFGFESNGRFWFGRAA